MNGRPSSVRVFGSSLVADPYSPQFKRYVYGGMERTTAKAVKPETAPKTAPEPTPAPAPKPRPVPNKSLPCVAEGCANKRHAREYCRTHARKVKAGRPLDADARLGAGFDPAKCGTLPGYASHARYNVPVDDACLAAKSEYDRERYEQRKKAAA